MFVEKSDTGYKLKSAKKTPDVKPDILKESKSANSKQSNYCLFDFINRFEKMIMAFSPGIKCNIVVDQNNDIVKGLNYGFSYKNNVSNGTISIPIEYNNNKFATLEIVSANKLSPNHLNKINLLVNLFAGSIYHVQKSINTENKYYQLLAHVQDCSNPDVTTERIMHQKKIQSLQQLAGGLSHEFNNLLGAIIGLTDNAIKHPDPNETSSVLETILEVTEKASQIINKLFKFSGLQKPSKDFVYIDRLINDVLDLMSNEFEKEKITVDKSFKQVPEVYVDFEMIKQAFLSIILNAIEIMDNGGLLQINLDADEVFTVVEFKDSGPGLSVDDLDDIFVPFHSTKSVMAGGSSRFNGLGLSMAYGIVTAHGGDITAVNSNDNGAVFTVKLPIKPLAY